MRKTKVMVLFLVLTLTTSWAFANNLLQNPSFEDWESGWIRKEIAGATEFEIDEEFAYHGISSARVAASSPAEGYWQQEIPIAVVEGQTYQFSALNRREFIEGGEGAVAVALFRDKAGRTVEEKVLLKGSGTSNWVTMSQQFHVPAKAVTLQIRLGLRNARGAVYWDQLELTASEQGEEQALKIADGFEVNFSNWKLRAASGKLDAVQDKGTKHSGTSAARISSSDASARGWLQSNFEIQGGKRYRISAWVKADKVSKQAGLRGKLFDSGNKYFIMEGNPYLDNAVGDLVFFRRGGSYQWQEVSGWFDAPADATRLMVDLMLEGSGAVWWDDLAIEEIEPSSIIEEENGAELTISEGFEKDALASWTLRAASGKLDSALDKATKRSGAQAAQITSIDSNARGWLQRNFQIQGGKRYRISAWVKADRVSKSAGLRAKLFDSGNKYFPMDGNPYLANTVGDLIFFREGGTYQWQEVSGWFDAPADTARVMVDLMLEGTGTVWWDDLTIEEIDPSTMDEEQVDQIANSEGFERGFNGFNQHSVTGTLNFGLDQEHKHGGNIAAKVSSSTSTARGWLKKTFPIEGGKKYLLRVWTRGEKLLGAGAGLRGKLYNSANKYLPMEDNPFLANRVGDLVFFKLNGSYNWRQAGGWFDTPLDAKTITIDLMLEGSGTVWWDDLTLEQVEEISQDMIRQQWVRIFS